MTRPFEMIRARIVLPALLVAVASTAQGQLANASTAATALSGAFTATASGYNAVAWNPANLAMPGNPGFSLTLLAIDGSADLRPIDFQKLHDVQGQFVSPAVRNQWLQDATANGGESGGGNGGITELAFSLGSLAFQFNTKVATDANLSPDAVEGILFGNYGRDTTLHSLSLAGSRLQAAAYSTGAVSFGLPLAKFIPLTNFALGATVKYTVGHFLAMALDNGSAIGSDITGNFAAVLNDSANRSQCPDPVATANTGKPQTKFCPSQLSSAKVGSGVGLDLGGAWTIPGFRFGVSAQNLVNTFKWDTTKFAERSATALFTANSTPTTAHDSVDQPYASAPAALRARVAALKFKPVFAAGVAMTTIPLMTLSAEVRQQTGDGIEVGPKSTLAVGAEYRIVPFIPLRAGVATMTGGVGVSGGFGLHFLGFEMGAAAYIRKINGSKQSGLTVNAISIHP